METLGAAASAVAVVNLFFNTLRKAARIYTLLGYRYRHARFGWFGGYAVRCFRLVDAKALQEMHWNINTWTDEEVMNWKQSQLNVCNAIAVAVSSRTAEMRCLVADR